MVKKNDPANARNGSRAGAPGSEENVASAVDRRLQDWAARHRIRERTPSAEEQRIDDEVADAFGEQVHALETKLATALTDEEAAREAFFGARDELARLSASTWVTGWGGGYQAPAAPDATPQARAAAGTTLREAHERWHLAREAEGRGRVRLNSVLQARDRFRALLAAQVFTKR